MPYDMLAMGASSLGVATIVLLGVRSHWAHHRAGAGPPKRDVATAAGNAKADWKLKAKEATRGADRHAPEVGKPDRPTAVPVGPSGSSTTFRHPARNTTANDVINRALTIHFFALHKGKQALANGK